MAKKTRPTFSAPNDKAAPPTRDSQWVYRSDAAPAIAGKAAPAMSHRKTVSARPSIVAPAVARSASIVAPAAAPARSSGVVNCAALLLFPVALVTGLVLKPLTACFRPKP